KENWAILRAVSAEAGKALPWDSLGALRTALVSAVPHLEGIDEVPENSGATLAAGTLGEATFRPVVKDFYLTNPIARASALMAELSALAASRSAQPMAAE
ncbi:MAG: NADH-quinone oxidoreductase subunit G, partial [Rhodobacteraceae bacterium]|nr:NADH-quinone oxidoreductase subunit G [Paracoccaceae bacterium]